MNEVIKQEISPLIHASNVTSEVPAVVIAISDEISAAAMRLIVTSSMEVNTKEDHAKLDKTTGKLKALISRAEKERKESVAEALALQRAVNGLVNPFNAELKRVVIESGTKLKAFEDEEKRLAEIERKRLEEEERKRKEEADRIERERLAEVARKERERQAEIKRLEDIRQKEIADKEAKRQAEIKRLDDERKAKIQADIDDQAEFDKLMGIDHNADEAIKKAEESVEKVEVAAVEVAEVFVPELEAPKQLATMTARPAVDMNRRPLAKASSVHTRKTKSFKVTDMAAVPAYIKHNGEMIQIAEVRKSTVVRLMSEGVKIPGLEPDVNSSIF